MTRKIVTKETKSVLENSEKNWSPKKTELDDSSDMEVLVCDNNMPEITQQERRTLPGVTSLMNNHHLRLASLTGLPSLSTDVYRQELAEKRDVNIAEMNQARADDSVQHFHSPDVKYVASGADTEKTAYMHAEREDSKNYKESLNYSLHQNIAIPQNKSVHEVIPSETALTTSALLDGRAVSEQKLPVSFEEHNSFVSHSRMCYSGHHLEPLSPATAPSEKHQDACGNVLDRSPVNYSYQNYLSNWEQENNRFFNFTWRNDAYGEKASACVNSADAGSAKTLAKNNGIVNNINIDNCCFSKAYMTDTSCGSLGSNGRRRRRRVQTPVQRTAANMRERRRMCHLNVAFDHLKEHLPNIKNKQKLSRIQTLKAAIDYINLLRDSLSLR